VPAIASLDTRDRVERSQVSNQRTKCSPVDRRDAPRLLATDGTPLLGRGSLPHSREFHFLPTSPQMPSPMHLPRDRSSNAHQPPALVLNVLRRLRCPCCGLPLRRGTALPLPHARQIRADEQGLPRCAPRAKAHAHETIQATLSPDDTTPRHDRQCLPIAADEQCYSQLRERQDRGEKTPQVQAQQFWVSVTFITSASESTV
jgi:hypothetical protein